MSESLEASTHLEGEKTFNALNLTEQVRDDDTFSTGKTVLISKGIIENGKVFYAIWRYLGSNSIIGSLLKLENPLSAKNFIKFNELKKGYTFFYDVENSTEPSVTYCDIYEKAKLIFKKANLEIEEDEGKGNFHITIKRFIESYENNALEAIEDIIDEKKYSDELISATLSYIGEIRKPDLINHIKYLLKMGSIENSSIIRRGAISGFASLGDKNVVAELEKMLPNEGNIVVKKLLIRAIEYLKSH